MRFLSRFGSLLAVLVSPTSLPAQDLPILAPRITRSILQEVSGDAAFEHVRYTSQFQRRWGGNGLWTVAEYFATKAREVGLDSVRIIRQVDDNPPWNPSFADLSILGPPRERIASTIQSAFHLADYSRAADVTAPLVDLGAGDSADYARVDVRGKIVVTFGALARVMSEAVGRRGALGIVWYPDPRAPSAAQGTGGPDGFRSADRLVWSSIPPSGNGYVPTFAFVLSLRDGVSLARRINSSRTPVMAHAQVDAAFDSNQGRDPWQVMVEAVLPGSEPRLGQDIVLTAHIDEMGANDNASGAANVLEIGRAIARMVRDEAIPRPRRTIRFWWVTELASERQYFADNPTAFKNFWVSINQDAVGANQAMGRTRTQGISRLPATRFHFFNDVAESAVEFMVWANSSGASPHASFARLGTRQKFNALMVKHHGCCDEMTFLEAPIGIPAIGLINFPDDFWHTSDDDLGNVDPTQLGRNAALVALMTYVMASADAAAEPILASNTIGRGLERLGRNLRLGLSWVATASDAGAAFSMARFQVAYAVDRERRAVTSLGEIAPPVSARLAARLRDLAAWEHTATGQIENAYRARTGQAPPREASPTGALAVLQRLRPELSGGPKEFLQARGRRLVIGTVPGLQSQTTEVLNAVDGVRTGFDIYQLVAAEAREAEEYFSGLVTPEGVLAYLEKIEARGLIRLNRSIPPAR